MSDYNHQDIEKKWQSYWERHQTFKTSSKTAKPKYYVLDMFPYPSGAGLHVGHPLGYIATDIVARYKKAKGFNVLHPMGFDAFGLPAEQYAIQTGQHPAITTDVNTARYVEQLKNIGLGYDWSRMVRTCDPDYYKWTQWIFSKLFNSYFNKSTNKAEPIENLISQLEKEGSANLHAVCNDDTPTISSADWQGFTEREKENYLQNFRLAFQFDGVVNWCPDMGTVLANEEVKDGFSVRGGFPVVQKKMLQWSLRITAYAERLLNGLDDLQWPEAVKEMQRNWIGKSVGAELNFEVVTSNQNMPKDLKIKVFTTRVDTTFGVTFLSLAPESELVDLIVEESQQAEVDKYVTWAKSRSERERMTEVKTISGVPTGAFAINPFNGEKIPVWIADYVLAGYGTGAVMAVPSSDTRDYAFAKHFNLPIIQVQGGKHTDISQPDFDPKAGTMINSGFLNGLSVPEAIQQAVEFVEKNGFGRGRVNFRLRNAGFTRQRYWGEPIPIYFENGIPRLLPENQLPLTLPEIDQYKPTETGEPPLARATDWKYEGQYNFELSTMPGWAGSSWYFLRYMDSENQQALASQETLEYWQQVDLYVGGAEHATGHLLYSRFWQKFLFDLGIVPCEEPFKKLVNQGMIQGRSNFVYRIKGTNRFASLNQKDRFETSPIHVDVNMVDNDVLNISQFKMWRPDLGDAEFELEPDGTYLCGAEVEKMSKSLFNVVNPDTIVEKYGADTLRVYEMFLGPLEQFKPWNTNGIEGVNKFLKRFWRLFFTENGQWKVNDEPATAEELKVLHKTIKKTETDIELLSFNTSVSSFMICVNELTSLKTSKRAILEPFTICLAPFAPHICEELWALLGHSTSISEEPFPVFNEQYLVENTFDYPISINGKVRTKLSFAVDKPAKEIEDEVIASEVLQKWLEGKSPRKVIVVPNRIVNVVI
jgi:leucyl-tRNA synthetase